MRDSKRDAEIASLYPALTFRQIGARFGLSGQRVHQILKRDGYEPAASRSRPVADRFWEKVTKGDGCWEWQGARIPHGYGNMTVPDHGHDYAHRISWQLHNGEIPAGLWVLHHCDNPPCVRPDHLFLGTAQDNVDDSIRKGRRTTRGAARVAATSRFAGMSQVEADAALVRELLDEWGESA